LGDVDVFFTGRKKTRFNIFPQNKVFLGINRII